MTLRNLLLELRQEVKQALMSRRSLYNEVKATQAACLLVKLSGGKLDYLKCIKLLYYIEREALKRWLHPVFFDDLYSLPHGQVVSHSLDRAKYRQRPAKSFWTEHLRTTPDNLIFPIKECGVDRLSLAEIDLIKEIFKVNKNKTPEQLMYEHHRLPEYRRPGKSRIETKYSDLLELFKKTDQEISEFEADLQELANLEALIR